MYTMYTQTKEKNTNKSVIGLIVLVPVIAMAIILIVFISCMANAEEIRDVAVETNVPTYVVHRENVPTYVVEHHETTEVNADTRNRNVYTAATVVMEDEDEEAFEIEEYLGDDIIDTEGAQLVRHELPSYFYDDIDFSSFQPYMSYKLITDRSSPAYEISRSENTYVDDEGLLRYETTDDQFTIDGEDDYVIALGTYYKEKGTCGSRYLIVTSTGMYTAIAGDEKSDEHTEKYNVCTMHDDYAGMIEWIVDPHKLDHAVKRHGTVTASGVEEIQGEILYIYEII